MLTMMLTPFVPCTGRLAVLAFLAPAFFGANAPWAMVALVGGNLVLLGIVGVAVNKLVFKGERSAFIMEMPLYHKPNARTIGLYVWRNTMAFIKKAGTLIVRRVGDRVGALQLSRARDPSESVLGVIGQAPGARRGPDGAGRLAPDRGPDLQLRGQGEQRGHPGGAVRVGRRRRRRGAGLAAKVAAVLTPAAAAAFLVVQMTFVPCVATVAAIKQESRSWRWTGASVGLMLVVAFVLGSQSCIRWARLL